MRGRYLLPVTTCIGAALALALYMLWGTSPQPGAKRASSPVVVVPSAFSAKLTPAPLTAPAAGNLEKKTDAATIALYRDAVRKMLGLGDDTVFRGVVMPNFQQHIVCGEVSKDGGSFQQFVYVGNASIAAIDDGSPDFKEMQRGACGDAPRTK